MDVRLPARWLIAMFREKKARSARKARTNDSCRTLDAYLVRKHDDVHERVLVHCPKHGRDRIRCQINPEKFAHFKRDKHKTTGERDKFQCMPKIDEHHTASHRVVPSIRHFIRWRRSGCVQPTSSNYDYVHARYDQWQGVCSRAAC